MALTDSRNSDRLARLPFVSVAVQALGHVRGWLEDNSHRSITGRMAGTVFLIRVFSAGLIYLTQIFFARWMGTHEFGIYVYVWTWVLMIGDMADLGLATGAQRFIEPGPKAYAVKTWFSVSLPILLVESFHVVLTNTDILVLKQFCEAADVAIYYAAGKTLALIAFVHFAVSAAVAHRFSEYFAAEDRERLNQILMDSIRWTFWASLAACVFILTLGRPLLSLFGPQFVGGYHLMFILAIGLMARSAIGPVERLLSMLGQQRVCAGVYAAAFVLNLVLYVVLIPRMGVEGAAVATSTALIVESVLLFFVTRRRLGLHVFIWRGS